jgi:yecA family protein
MMKMFTAGEGRKLKGILSKVTDPDCSFNPAQLHGFFFGLALTPEPVMPSEWLTVVFASDGPLFENEKDV